MKYEQLHLIITGADNTGKSTLIKNFINMVENGIDELPPFFIVTKFSKPISEVDAQLTYRKYLDFIQKNNFTIADRCFYDEAVYGKLYRDVDDSYIYELDEKFANTKNSIFILCHADKDWIKERWDGIELNGHELEDIDIIQNKFNEVFKKSKAKKFKIDMSKIPKRSVVLYMLENIKKTLK